MSAGGYVRGPEGSPALPMRVRLLRQVEPGLQLVSINGGPPEYLMSAGWVRAHSQKSVLGLDDFPRYRANVTATPDEIEPTDPQDEGGPDFPDADTDGEGPPDPESTDPDADIGGPDVDDDDDEPDVSDIEDATDDEEPEG